MGNAGSVKNVAEAPSIPVALIIDWLELGGGAERQLTEIALGLGAHEFGALVVSLRPKNQEDPASPDNYCVRILAEGGSLCGKSGAIEDSTSNDSFH